MQEEFKNKLKRTAKKLAAIGTGALVAGTTLVGATFASDLSGLPAPFITNGAFDAYIVIGTSAATITAATLQDIQGSIELATALGQLATTSAGAEGSATLSLRQFTGENLAGVGIDTTVANTHHAAQSASWGNQGSSSTLVALDDLSFIRSDNVMKNATIAVDLDDNYVEFNKDSLAIHINSSTDSVNVFTVTLGTNRTGAAGHFEKGDSINWFGTPYEIVDVLTDGNVSLGNTETVQANEGESFTIGGQTFTLEKVGTTTAVIKDSSNAVHYINSTYSTIGSIDLRASSLVGDVAGYEYAVFETVENSYKFALNTQWPLDTDFVVDSVTVDTTNENLTQIVLRNNKTFDLDSKNDQAAIAGGLNFIYTDNTEDVSSSQPSLGDGGIGAINISEASGVTNYVVGHYDGVSAAFTTTTFNLPGATIYNFTVDDVRSDPITALANLSYGDKYNRLYLRDDGSLKYEVAFKPLSTGNMTYIIPENANNYTSNPQGTDWTTTVSTAYSLNHTTPSGVKVVLEDDGNHTFVSLKVAAVQIDIDSSTYYGRKGSSWTEPKYSKFAMKVNYVADSASTGTVTVSEPTGLSLAAKVTFDDNDNAVFSYGSDVAFNGAAVTGYQFANMQSTVFGSDMAFYAINGTTYNESATDPIEHTNAIVDDVLQITAPQKSLVMGLGALQDVNVTLDTDPNTSIPVNSSIGNTTVTLSSGSGSSVSVNKVSPGFSKLDSEITTSTLAKPVILMGGSGINGLVKNLKDSGLYDPTDLTTQGSGHAKVAFVENAFNSQTALVIAGYSGSDTLMASRAIASALLNKQPFDFANENMTNLLLNTGTSVVNEVSVHMSG
jgi:hypothetical protein